MPTSGIRLHYHLLRRERTCSCLSSVMTVYDYRPHLISRQNSKTGGDTEIFSRQTARRVTGRTDLRPRQCNSITVTAARLHNLNRAECSGMQRPQIRNLADAGPIGSPRVASHGILNFETWTADDCMERLSEPCRSRTLFWGLQSGRSIVEKGRGQKRTTPTPTPTREGPASGWPLALALPQKSPKPRLSLFPHRAVQIFIRHTHLLADSVRHSVTPRDEFSVSAPAFFSRFPPDRGPISMRKVGQCLASSQATYSCGRNPAHDNESGPNTSTGRVHRPTALSLTHANPAVTRG